MLLLLIKKALSEKARNYEAFAKLAIAICEVQSEGQGFDLDEAHSGNYE